MVDMEVMEKSSVAVEEEVLYTVEGIRCVVVSDVVLRG
jgi:hypothetical protein